jgi:hypothetical protein
VKKFGDYFEKLKRGLGNIGCRDIDLIWVRFASLGATDEAGVEEVETLLSGRSGSTALAKFQSTRTATW